MNGVIPASASHLHVVMSKKTTNSIQLSPLREDETVESLSPTQFVLEITLFFQGNKGFRSNYNMV